MKRIWIVLSVVLALASCKKEAEVVYTPSYEEQAITLPGVFNARQLGGYVIGDRKVRNDVLIRSGALSDASDEALATLHDRYKLAMVTDFRTSLERGSAPDREVEGAQNIWQPVLEKLYQSQSSPAIESLHKNRNNLQMTVELLRMPEAQQALREIYSVIVFDEDNQNKYAAFLDSLVTLPEGRAALWHCSHGKDRCGWGTAFVLAALGADRSLIVDDFVMSNIPYSQDIQQLLSFVKEQGLEEELSDYVYLLRGVSKTVFEETLDEIDARFGSIDNYLERALDLTPAEKQTLRTKFLL